MADQATAALDPAVEILRCQANPLYFVWHYCRIKNEKTKRYEPFKTWPAQVAVLKLLWLFRFVVALKARQVGMTTLVVAYAVWLALFRPGSTILIFSKTQKEAKDMLKRVKATIRGLPDWMQPSSFVVDATQELELSNGSRFITFASRGPGGDSYTASLVIIDEADLIPNLNELLEGAEPTVAADGKMVLLSRVSKGGGSGKGRDRVDRGPNSPFKKIYKAAVAGLNEYQPAFIAWFDRPDRTQAWYEQQRRKIESRTGALDDLYAQYPATPEEALAPRELDRRFPAKRLLVCFERTEPIPSRLTPWPNLEGLRVYTPPEPGRRYVIGADVALGNPNSDDSVAVVLERSSQRQVAILAAKLEPGELAIWLARLAGWYNGAPILAERNHYGQHCIKELLSIRPPIAPKPRLLVGRDNKYGWWTDYQGKRLMYAQLADSVRCGSCVIVDQQTFDQLASLDTDELNAPEGEHDDCAIAFAMAVYACSTPERKPELTVLSFDRGNSSAVTAEPVGPPAGSHGPVTPVEGVEWFEGYGEWWARLTVDGNRIDLYGSAERTDAEAAMTLARAMLDTPGPVAQPPASERVASAVWLKLSERGWIKTV